MRERDCDVAVIGAGTAGIGVYRAATEAGPRAVLIEGGPAARPAPGSAACPPNS